jgi:hypothetical protein
MRVRSTGQLGKYSLDPSCRGSESEDTKGLTKIVTTLIAIGRLQCGQLPDAVGVPERGIVISVPGPAARLGESAQLCSCRGQIPAPPKGVGRGEDGP